MSYDYSNLSDADFEDLVRALLGQLLDVRFEAFGRGPDGGMDGRHSKCGKTTVLQAKHFQGSNFSSLKSAMKKERKSIDSLAPQRYLLATSRPLQPANKKSLANVIGPCLKEESDIFGRNDLDALLRKYPEIEKAHIKLWLSSAAVLEKVLHAATTAFTDTTQTEIRAKVRVYAQNPSLAEARDKLENQHVVIISGPPGVGKTTLAEMLSFAYIAEGWEFVAIRGLDDGFARIDDSKKQVFLFDDFLGRVALDAQSLASKDAVLAKFIKRIANSPNARFILTTRAYILEGARQKSEHLASQGVGVAKYLLDVGVYTRRIKARILYNHIGAADLPPAHIQALREADAFMKIVDHKNYNPRIIEAMTEALQFNNISANDYADAFLAALENPHQIWDIAFRTHISDASRHLLYAVYFSSEYGVDLDELRAAFDALHRHLCEKYRRAFSPKDFEETLKTLEGGFLSIGGSKVSFVNPSLRDYLNSYLDDCEMLCDFASSATKVSWARAVWRQSGDKSRYSEEDRIRIAESMKPVVGKFKTLPVMKQNPNNPHSYSFYDDCYGTRVHLLLELWDLTKDIYFSDQVLPCAGEAVRGMTIWRDGPEFIELIMNLRAGFYEEFPNAEEVTGAIEEIVASMLDASLSSEDLDNLFSAIDHAREYLSEELINKAISVVRSEVENVGEMLRWEDSESTLSEHAEVLERLASKAEVPSEEIASAMEAIHERIEEIQQRSSAPASPPQIRSGGKDESERFGDEELRSLFDTLKSSTLIN